ncbi:MAG: DNA primase [Parabacteroides sp.]|uniref:DNA primase n=1 Tax=Parabacteroides faecalis TaxID=2924040 RepID=A0ABT0C5D5_9BACT|nr:DNA primase [Parabacteroides faecalis]MCI7707908.1 DNA primase [Parabacteroides sp.]MDY5622698.1 DNA primase [Bacteroidales bacterium]MCJ2382236.1 DNA primase [Parabacteroides faecalis]MDD6952445.1 DNA primase [Parabacteroides sp.]MDD7560368.1 DNA primase [Parabacteroides sp.]
MIDQPTIDRILDAANIVDVVSEFVTLRKRGVNYVGLCPFHDDKSPSFYVSPAKNICKCFACGEGGTAVHFIMKHEQIGYFDALRFLAKKYNIEIAERELSDEEKRVRSDRESMFIVNAWAQQYFSQMLHEHVEGKTVGMRYFIERGFREDTIRKFQLGYSLDQRDALYQQALRKGYKKEYLEKTGLVIAYENGNVNDRFRGRVIFPVHSLSGKVVAFGGRVLKKDEKTAKYVNSPESPIYHKSNELYGIYFAKQAIVKADRCYLVEGYTDVISMHQSGVENVVASSGTALTHGQIRLIHRFTNNITVLYDGDAAGIKAAIRGIDLLLDEGMNVKVVLLPDGEDPDSFARSHSATEFTEFIRQHETDFIRFKTKLLLADAGNDPVKRAALIGDIIRTIAIVPDDITRTIYIRECSAMMEIDEQVVLNQVNKQRLSKNEQKPSVPVTNRSTTEILPPDYSISEPSGQMQEVPVATAEPVSDQLPPDFPPPPEEEFSGSNEMPEIPPSAPVEETQVMTRQRSPYEAFEIALLRYVVRYGERVLYDYVDEETKERIVMRVAEFIRDDLERDDLSFYTPIFKQMLDEAANRCGEETFIAHRYFLSHPDPLVSRVAANLMSEKYQLSKYHFKFREVEQEEDKLDQLVVRDLFAFKEAYIMRQLKEKQEQLKQLSSADPEQIMTVMKEIAQLNEIKKVLSKELGERIILKM